MDFSSNSFGDAQVVPVVRPERVGAYDSSNLRKRQDPKQEQGQRRRAQLQHMARLLAGGNLAEAKNLLDELRQDDPLLTTRVSPPLIALESAFSRNDLDSARQAIEELQHPGQQEGTSHLQAAHLQDGHLQSGHFQSAHVQSSREADQPVSDDVREILDCKDEQDPHGNLDVIA